MGHSQGGMSMRWALRFWPDTRRMVDDVIGFSGSNHGTTALGGTCSLGCPPADWQQGANANFIKALNSYAETFAGISYTEIWTHTDEVVDPAGDAAHASAALHTGRGRITNVATQDLCPRDIYEHLTIGTVDPVAYALAVDALTHPGPAVPARVPRSVCSQTMMPGINPLDLNTYIQVLGAQLGLAAVDVPGINVVGVQEVKREPPLACYVLAAGCNG
jgi:triacylglycerol esterase/lipase EstA (alpha/beta hydrolase family)